MELLSFESLWPAPFLSLGVHEEETIPLSHSVSSWNEVILHGWGWSHTITTECLGCVSHSLELCRFFYLLLLIMLGTVKL